MRWSKKGPPAGQGIYTRGEMRQSNPNRAQGYIPAAVFGFAQANGFTPAATKGPVDRLTD